MGQEQSTDSSPRKKSSVVSRPSHYDRQHSHQSGRSGGRSPGRSDSRNFSFAMDLMDDVYKDMSFVDIEKFASSFKPRKYSHFQPFIPPNLCKLCHMVSDHTGDTDLISPCGCDGTSLHVHETCLKSWLQSSGKVRCEACKAVYSNSNIKELQAQLSVQRVNFCLIAIMMPVGVIVIVGACVMMDSITQARARAAAAGMPVEGLGIPMDRFIIFCVIFGSLTLAAILKTISIMRAKKVKMLENLTVTHPGDEARPHDHKQNDIGVV